MLNHIRHTVALIGLLAASTSCVTNNVDVHSSPSEDSEYYKIYQDSTKENTVYKDFETKFKIQVTYLSPEFRTAFTKRMQSIYLNDAVSFEHERTKAGFFVTLYTPVDSHADLMNNQHWTILYGEGDKAMKPILVKRLNDKERWRGFFDGISKWTNEYLVVFDAANVTPHSPALVQENPTILTFANADGRVKLTW